VAGPDSLLDAIETRIGEALRADAEATGRGEAIARVLLALQPDGLTMGETARRIARDPTTVTRFVEKGEAAGLVVRRPGLEDRRERLVFLTDAGREARSAILARRLARDARLKETVGAKTGLSAEEVEWFLTVLHDGLADGGTASESPTA
jgi:DNA-binding MarR family transcriptional regulator